MHALAGHRVRGGEGDAGRSVPPLGAGTAPGPWPWSPQWQCRRRAGERASLAGWELPGAAPPGRLVPLDPGARLVHADVLPYDPQPLLRRGDRLPEGGRAEGHRLGVIRVARRPQRGVAGASVLEGEQGPGSRSSAASSSRTGGRAAVRAHTCRRRESTSHFQIVVSTFTRITNRGHPWRMLLVACHHRPRAPAILKARRSSSKVEVWEI